jgi:hypothetical protein
MSEIERLIHLIASMQILFGSRRGGFLILLLILGLAFGGWMTYNYAYSPERAVEVAHQKWNSNDTKQRIAAIKQYESLLLKTDPIDPARRWVKDDRDVLYRRVIVHELLFEEDESKAAEMIKLAWDEGHRDLRFHEEKVKDFWNTTTEPLQRKNLIKNKNANPN